MDNNMENEMNTVVIRALYRGPSIQMIPTLGPEVCKFVLHQWAICMPLVP